MPKNQETYEMKNVKGNSQKRLSYVPKSPVEKHGCTDIICAILFLIFIGYLTIFVIIKNSYFHIAAIKRSQNSP